MFNDYGPSSPTLAPRSPVIIPIRVQCTPKAWPCHACGDVFPTLDPEIWHPVSAHPDKGMVMTTRYDTCLHIPVPPPSRCSSCGCEAAPHVLLFESILPIPSCRCRPAFGDGGLQSILVGMPGLEPGFSLSLTGRDSCFATFRKPAFRPSFLAVP